MFKTGWSFSSDTIFRWLFHLVFWSVWIFFPLINSGYNTEFRQFYLAIMPVVLSNIPLFLLNSEWLIPHVFRRRGLGIYLLWLLALIIVFSFIHFYGKLWLAPPNPHHPPRDIFWTVIAVTFLTAISTGYGFIVYLLKQEKLRQEGQRERLQSEVAFLRSQISPHFIFNVLNSIVYLIRSKSDLAEQVTLKLSELMRYMLYDSRHEQVPLEMEIDYLKNYVELQKIRFEEDVLITLNIEGVVGTHSIEPLLLIPFVENAFKHGVGLIKDPVIEIALEIDDHQLFFKVTNKISPEEPGDKDSSSGIGLRNVRRRLELLYPGKHQLDIQSDEQFFSVDLHLNLCNAAHPLK